MNIRFWIADEIDAEKVAELGSATFSEMWQPFYSPEDMQEYLQSSFNVDLVSALLRKTDKHLFVLVEVDGELAGYSKLTLGTSLSEFDGVRTLEIERYYLFKKHHGSGIADRLMEFLLEFAAARGFIWMYLGVDVNNHRAIRFYTRYGFKVFGRKDFMVGKVVDTDQLMKRRVKTD